MQFHCALIYSFNFYVYYVFLNFFIYFFFCTKISPNIGDLETATSGVTAGFGDALTAALDVMAFAHEIDLATATEGIPTTDLAAKAAKSQQLQQQAKVTSNASSISQRPIREPSSTCLQMTHSQNHDLAQSEISKLPASIEPRPGNTALITTTNIGMTNGIDNLISASIFVSILSKILYSSTRQDIAFSTTNICLVPVIFYFYFFIICALCYSFTIENDLSERSTFLSVVRVIYYFTGIRIGEREEI